MGYTALPQASSITEGSTGEYRCVLRDMDGAPLADGVVNSILLTLTDRSGTIVNNRQAVEAFGAAGGSSVVAGAWTFKLTSLDTVAPEPKGTFQLRRMSLDVRGTDFRLTHVCTFYVQKLVDID